MAYESYCASCTYLSDRADYEGKLSHGCDGKTNCRCKGERIRISKKYFMKLKIWYNEKKWLE